MREIKFRAWHRETKGMHYTPDIQIRALKETLSTHSDSYEKIKTWDLMQFTGRYDVNGKEIYEGDIIKHRYFSKKGIAEVRWSNEEGYYLAIEPDGSRTMLNANSEIIGNIHENPELISQQ